MQKFNFENLDVYQKSAVLISKIYNLTKGWPKEYLYDMTSQIRRAALSIALNIAEGSGRSEKDFIRFLSIARGSCLECVAIIDITARLSIITQSDRKELTGDLIEISKMLTGLKKSLTTNSELLTLD